MHWEDRLSTNRLVNKVILSGKELFERVTQLIRWEGFYVNPGGPLGGGDI